MKIVVPQRTLAWILRSTQCVLFASGVSMMGYCGLVLADAWISQAVERRDFDRLLADRHGPTDRAHRTASLMAPQRWAPAMTGDLVGRLEVPRLSPSVMVMEGTSEATLRRAVGHIPGTALPGESGNMGLSGHRDTFFRPLRNIQRNDIITFTTLLGEYRYRVVSTKVVDPRDVAVLSSSEKPILTLITCYPFYFVALGPEPVRRARREG